MVNNNFDNCTSFHIDNGAFMGRLVRLDKVVNTILGRHQYPRQVSAVVAESTALGALLSSTIKYNGLFTLQTQSSGPVTMVVVDVTSEGRIRACANVNQEMLDKALELRKSDTDELLAAPHYMGNGHQAFTVDQGPETDLYQGIVDLQGKNLSECALRYFKQSEQIETYLQLFLQAPDKDGESWKAAGILLQKLPDNGGKISDDTEALNEAWNEAVIFAQSLKAEEVFDEKLSAEEILTRLFHANKLEITKTKEYHFGCRCSRDKLFNTLHAMADKDIEDMCENNKITATCHFCGEVYSFDKGELLSH